MLGYAGAHPLMRSAYMITYNQYNAAIQSFFTEIGRVISRKQGWYQDRRSVQFFFVLIFGCFAFFTIACVWWVLRKKWRIYLTPLCGFLFLIAFIVIRAASFHHFDNFLNFRPFGARMNWILELGGISILFYSSLGRFSKE